MPEGPEIRRAADEIAAVLEGQRVEQVRFGLPRLRRYNRQLQGHKVLRLETRGKALLTHFEHGLSIYSHNQLYGVWRVQARGKIPESSRSLRLALHTASHSALLYSASDISVWATAELPQHPFLARIGPDILDASLDWRAVAQRLQSEAFRGRRLASLYLDQRFLAGIGNYLRSEILFAAGLHPGLRPRDLGRGELGRLSRSTLDISRRSYQTAGITQPAARHRALQRRGLDYEQRRFMVFGREGLPCYNCGDEVIRQQADSRGLFVCRYCQPPP